MTFAVIAGSDMQVAPGGPVALTASEIDDGVGGTATVASRAWTVVTVPAGNTTVAALVGTTIGTATGLSWTAPTVAGIYKLRYTAYSAGPVELDHDEVQVEATTNASIPIGTPIVIKPDTIPSTEAFGTPRFVQSISTLPLVPTYPGDQTFPGPTTFPGGSLDTRYRAPRTGWTTYPGPATFPGAATWPGFGLPEGLPPFQVEFFLLTDSGRYRCPLPDVKACTLTDVANGAGSVSFDYPVGATNFDQLREHVDQGVDARVAVRFAGSAEWELQAILFECDADDVAEGATWQFRGDWSAALLGEADVWPDPGSSDGKVRFVDATPGAMLLELGARAQARGGFDVDTSTFSAGFDSHGRQWPTDSVASPSFAPGDSSSILRVLGLLADAGLCEWEMRGRSLRLYPRGGRGFDRTIGTPVVLQGGRDLIEASRRHNVRGAVTSLLVLGADGDWVEAADDTALGRRRRRIEGTVSQGSLSGGSLRAYARAKLATSTSASVERVHKLAVFDDSPLPMRDFQVGDWVWSDSDGQRRRLRVAQWTLTLDDNGLSGSVSLGDLIDDPLLKLARRVLGIGDGSTVVGGGSGGSSAALVPAAPTGLTVDSITSPQADGSSIATLLVSWDPVTAAEDGVTGVLVAGYRLRWRYVTTTAGIPLVGQWTVLDDLDTSTSAQIDGVVPDAQVEVQVGCYSFNTVTPQIPEPPAPDPGTGTGTGTDTGGGSATPVPTSIAEALRLGAGSGLTKVNLGVDFLPGEGPSGFTGKHKDYTLAEIVAGLDTKAAPKYVEMRPDGAVRLTAFVGGATTPNSTHSRTEFRELADDGKAKAEWSSLTGDHYVYCVGKIIKLPKGRQRVCIAQVHTPKDDLSMVLVDQGVNVESTYGDTGRPGRLTSNLQLGAVNQWGIELVREGSQTLIQFYWNSKTPVATKTYEGGTGLYFKFGSYQQSSTQYDSVGETCIIDLYDAEIGHTSSPNLAARRPYTIGWTGAGAGPGTSGSGSTGGSTGGTTGGTTGGGTTGGTQTLGVGGIATPAAGPGVVLVTSDSTSALTITQANTTYDGGGHKVGRITVKANGVTVQNFRIVANGQYGAVLDGNDITFQNNDITGVRPSGDGDLNAITAWGNGMTIRYNTAINFVSGDPGDSHTDFIQTWVSSSHPVAGSNWKIIGNKATGPANPSRSNSVASIHQCVMAEDYGRGGNSGGSSSGMKNWLIADNEFGDSWNQCIKLDGVDSVSITRNRFVGSSDKQVDLGSGASDVKYYSDNQVAGSYGSVGISVTPGNGPA